MPEGLEVFILSKVLKDMGYSCYSLGKHLILTHPYTGELLDYSFGLAGRVKINDDSLELKKINHPKIVSGSVEKVKDMDTGGKHTALNDPIMFDFNSGLGFKVNGVDPLQKLRPKQKDEPQKKLPLNQPDIVNGKEMISFSEKINNDMPF